MISDLIKKLIQDAEREKYAREFWEDVEKEAQELEITVDYYLYEFFC